MIAALFVETNGCYFNDSKIDPFDKIRDAKTYNGNFPVIAHPPCQLWGKMAIVNYKRWGGDHNKPGNDGGCFEFALNQVNRCGGVLEHPAQSYAWECFNLTKPEKGKWVRCGDGFVCEVWQSAYGHLANKKTWLYYKGNIPPFDLCFETPKGKYQIGYADRRGKLRNKPTVPKRMVNATPEKFKIELIKLALHSKKI